MRLPRPRVVARLPAAATIVVLLTGPAIPTHAIGPAAGAQPAVSCDGAGAALTTELVRGVAPHPTSARPFTPFRNDDRVCQASWVPGVGQGFVPQGLAIDTGSEAILSGYLVDPATGVDRRRCAVVTLDLKTGMAGDLVDLGRHESSAECEHAGGIAILPTGEVVLSDQEALFVFQDVDALLAGSQARRIALSGDDIVGSFLVPQYGDGLLWVGTFENSIFSSSILHAIELDVLRDSATHELEGDGEVIRVARAAQGAAWDGDLLAVVSSSPQCGHVRVSDARGNGGRTYEIGPGAQAVTVVDGRLLVLHEAGTGPHQGAYFPVVALYERPDLREGGACILLPSRDGMLFLLLALLVVGVALSWWIVRRARRRAGEANQQLLGPERG
jgi:hypothetical protein